MNKRIILSLSVLLLIPFSTKSETQYQLQVDGLVCPFCEYNVQKKLSKLDGVVKVEVNLKQGQVSVLMVDGKTLSEQQATKEMTDAGFTLKSFTQHKVKSQK